VSHGPALRFSDFVFLGQFWRAPRSVGAAWPSSRRLAEAMLAPVDFSRLRTLVEFGPGTGAITRVVRDRLGPVHRYLGIEVNPTFHARLRAEFPDLEFERASVAELGSLLDRRGVSTVEAIVCGLPWAFLPVALQREVLAQVDRRLAPGGVFVTFAYLQGLVLPGARALRRSLGRVFRTVTRTSIVWRNVPPAFAYICRR
jgi:phosphatidylethanolamine/phosphatidyl-N-methylethanolamine N-methyltransferase